MADHTPHQKSIIRNYYENRDTLALQKLAEAVSDLYVETSEVKIKRAWKSVHIQMIAAGVPKERADAIIADKDLGAVARIISERS